MGRIDQYAVLDKQPDSDTSSAGLTESLSAQAVALDCLSKAALQLREILEPLLDPAQDASDDVRLGDSRPRPPLIAEVQSHTERIDATARLLRDATLRLAL